MGIRTPTRWWRVANYVNKSEESFVISRVRRGNYGLVNRGDSMRDFGLTEPGNARILICLLCAAIDSDTYTPTLNKRLTEFHITMLCPPLDDLRDNFISNYIMTWH